MVEECKLSAVLGELARTSVTDFPIQSILNHLVKRIVEVLPITSAGVTLITPGAKPRYIAASDVLALHYEALQTEVGEGPCLVAYTSGAAVAVPDLATDDRFPRFAVQAVAAGLAAVFTFPLRQDEIRLGALDLYRDTPGVLDGHDMEAAQTLADVAAAYLSNAQARADAQATTERFRQSASHDPLTGLPNRLLLHQRLEHAAQRARRSHTAAAVLFADLDRFKAVNDTYGHQIGDGLLVAVAQRLTSVLRPGDTLARVSGDEFVILCEDLADAAYVKALASRIDVAFSAPFDVLGIELAVTASVGIAFAGPGKDVSAQLMSDADTAMYQAKRSGGARHQVIDLREASRVSARLDLERDLRIALSRNQLQVHYQPVVRSSDGLVTGVEALLRWTHPTHGPVAPQTVVSMAEQAGLITELGLLVLERACRDRQRWLSRYPLEPFAMAVNVSTTQLSASGFCTAVAAVLADTGTEPHDMVLEMTEDVFLLDADRARTVLLDLKQLGVSIALDDFGTGYCSLRYLRRFPVDVLKIDQTLLADIGYDPVSAVMLSTITNLAHILRLSVTAEGVENQRQRDGVLAAGCESSQGYFYARPMPADCIAHVLHAGAGRPPQLPAVAST